MQGYGAMSLTEFAQPVIAPNAEATLRHVLESGVSVLNTAGVHNLPCCIPDLLAWMRAASTSFCILKHASLLRHASMASGCSVMCSILWTREKRRSYRWDAFMLSPFTWYHAQNGTQA